MYVLLLGVLFPLNLLTGPHAAYTVAYLAAARNTVYLDNGFVSLLYVCT